MDTQDIESAFAFPGYSMSVVNYERRDVRRAYIVTVREVGGMNAASGTFVADEHNLGKFEDIYVTPDRRRRGIATAIYDAFELAGFDLRPSDLQLEDGELFWEARLARPQTNTPSP